MREPHRAPRRLYGGTKANLDVLRRLKRYTARELYTLIVEALTEVRPDLPADLQHHPTHEALDMRRPADVYLTAAPNLSPPEQSENPDERVSDQ
jgi:hypothetical protein